jgi:PAS domain S-box-containing protein
MTVAQGELTFKSKWDNNCMNPSPRGGHPVKPRTPKKRPAPPAPLRPPQPPSDTLYYSLFERVPVGLYRTTPEGRILAANPALQRLLGYAEIEALLKMNAADLYLDPAERAQGQAILERDGILRDFQMRLRRSDGSIVWVKDTTRAIRDSRGRLLYYEGVIEDIDERKQAESAMARQTQELARSNAELEQFASIVSHDLQEPLRMVRNFAELLAERYRDKLDADAGEFIGYVVDGARRMQELIQALLEYSRGTTRWRPLGPTDTNAVLESVLRDLSLPLQEAGATVTRERLPTVMADGRQLGQLLQNLISNAVKFRGQAAPRIHVGAARRAGEWLFSVRDNGIGIEAAECQRIFGIFERAHPEGQYPGTGVGLAIAKCIVERHGGRIWVESEPGSGSVFYFTVPADVRRKHDNIS